MTDSNFVQSLDKKRGRPKSRMLAWLRKEHPNLSSRQSLYNRSDMFKIGLAAVDAGLADQEFRDKQTGRRLLTKLTILGRLFDEAFWESESGKKWLIDNWRQIVDLTTEDILAWAKSLRGKS